MTAPMVGFIATLALLVGAVVVSERGRRLRARSSSPS